MTDKSLIQYSEIFYSIQGEGYYCGVATSWLRFFLCNLNCDGFGQKDPKDPSTYILPYKDFDVSTVNRIEDLPVWKYGCDSSYSWSAKFKHLQYSKTASEICNLIEESMKNEHNPNGLFLHPHSGVEQHMCFTGGEPLMRRSQQAVIMIMKEFIARGNIPKFITFETNGTQPLTEEFINFFNDECYDVEVFFSVSPKLFTVSGEQNGKAINPGVVESYQQINNSHMQLKFVMGTAEEQWIELERVILMFRLAGVHSPVYIMPIGATEEDQLQTAGEVATMAFQRGYNVSARVHCYLWGNSLGV